VSESLSQPPSEATLLRVTDTVAIPRSELEARASRAGGAGGQHVNTSSTRVELRWNVAASRALDDRTRARVLHKLATRIDSEGVLRVVASKRRSQLQNREQAEERLVELVRDALAVPKPRRKTKPTRASKEKRLESKKRNASRKRDRRVGGWEA
jgi:ribosome-associated protein